MTLDDLAQFLPNGFHDAELVRLDINYEARKTVMFLNVDCSDAANKLDASYRPVSITFSDVQFVVVDPPKIQETLGASTIDAGPGQPPTAPLAVPALWGGVSLCWIFLSRFNSFVRIAAREVELRWLD